MKPSRVILALTVLVAPLAACASTLPPTTYKSEPAEAWVVDAVTGKPVEGAVVVAYWEMSVHGQKVSDDLYSPKIIETVTDSKGHFAIPGWGPEEVCCGFMEPNDPGVLIFKPGYEGMPLASSYSAVVNDPKDRDHYWSGKTYRLQPFTGDYTGEQGKKDLDNFEEFSDFDGLGFLFIRPERCDWKLVPQFLRAQSQQISIFVVHNYKVYRTAVQRLEQFEQFAPDIVKKCGSPKEFLKGIEQ